MRLLPLLCLLALLLPSLSYAATIRVPADEPTIQHGINAAAQGDTVLVAPGTYTGPTNKNLEFYGVERVLRSEAGPAQTIIDCQQAGSGFFIHEVETSDCRIEGFTIQNASDCGVRCEGQPGGVPVSPTFVNCTIRENASFGVYSWYGNLTMIDCRIIDNDGSGMFCTDWDNTLSLERCTFRGNTISGLVTLNVWVTAQDCVFEANSNSVGGGVVWGGGGPRPRGASAAGDLSVFSRCLFLNNVVTGVGGGMSIGGFQSIALNDCIFIGNRAAKGGAIGIQGGGPTMRRCTLYDNSAPLGGGLYFDDFSGADIFNSIIAFSGEGEAIVKRGIGADCGQLSCTNLYGNAGGDWVDCVASQELLRGNLSADPLFCDAPAGNLYLRANSPCAPGNSPAGCGLIGTLPVVCGVVDVADSPSIANQQLAVIPNPVRGAARFELGPSASFRILNIFDSQGRLVEQLSRQDGHWEWTPGAGVSAGVYFARPEASGVDTAPVKFLYLR
jgi:hypothetical protein